MLLYLGLFTILSPFLFLNLQEIVSKVCYVSKAIQDLNELIELPAQNIVNSSDIVKTKRKRHLKLNNLNGISSDSMHDLGHTYGCCDLIVDL